MRERVAFLKHALVGGTREKESSKANKDGKESAGENIESLKREAIDVLFAEYEELRKQAEEMVDKDIAKANELIEQIDKKLDEIEALKNSENVLIDDLEKIIARDGENKRGGRSGEQPEIDPSERTILEVTGRTSEGEEVKVNLAELARHWNKFYQDKGIDWVEPIPEDIKLTEEQAQEMKRQIEVLGFDWPVIIPAGLTGEPEYAEVEEEEIDEKIKKKVKVKRLQLKKPAEHAEELHRLMSEGYKEVTDYSDNYKKDGGVGASRDSRKGLRIVIARKAKEMTDDEKLKATVGKSIDDLEAKDGMFEKYGVGGMTEAEYLIFQRIYFEETKKHLDETRWTCLAASRRPRSGRVPDGNWNTDGEGLSFDSKTTDSRDASQGCRLAGSFLL